MYKFLIIFLLLVSNVHAGTVDMPQYGDNDTLTGANLNLRWNLLTNQINSGLDNNNANTPEFWFIEVLASDPSPGNAGRVVFNTTDNTLKFDTGTSFVEVGVLQNSQEWTGVNTFTGNIIVDGTSDLNGNVTIDGTLTQNGTVDLNAKLTADASEIEGSNFDINGGTIDGTTIGSASHSTGKFTTLEATSTFKLGTTNQGDILYDNNTSIVRLTPGTSGNFLQTGGAAANPSWVEGMRKISTTTISSVSNSGDIAIVAGNRYKAYIAVGADSTAATLGLRFNSDAGSGDYAYVMDTLLMNTTATSTLTGDDVHDRIVLGPVNNETVTYIMEWNNTLYNGVNTIYIDITAVGHTGSAEVKRVIGGRYTNATAPTSFEVFTGGQDVSGEAILYEIL